MTDIYPEGLADTPWRRKNSDFLGKKVVVTLGTEDGKTIITKGQFLAYGEGGDFEILEDDGFVHFCWPLLDIELDPDG